jgi:hypothetical protein
MTRTVQPEYSPVDASPVKSFFVYMLTRDIKLEEAILDLLDNCVDGILRAEGKTNRTAKAPYDGFWAEIKFSRDSFSISDNCGGIPWDLHNYAFRMGRPPDRPDDTPGTVGVYGIGMKRAIFKVGKRCLISTQNGDHTYDVEIEPEWTSDEKAWSIPVHPGKKSMKDDGTTVVVGDLHPAIRDRFGPDGKSFKSDLELMISTHYAFIIDKGFQVKINGDVVRARATRLIFNKNIRNQKKEVIRPFIFKTKVHGVEVFLAVGFTRPIPSQDEIASEQEEKRYSSLDAGWTVICNGRAVLYCDRSELTGWGEAGVPRYHTQFIAISGIVEFNSDDASKLPTTTTKRGIDASSALYLQIKNKMREGMRIFTDYTNRWKLRPDESKKQIEAGVSLSLEEIKSESRRLDFRPTKKSIPSGSQFKPELPLPKKLDPQTRRISFVKSKTDVEEVAEYLFEDRNADPSAVGERCFGLIQKEAQK